MGTVGHNSAGSISTVVFTVEEFQKGPPRMKPCGAGLLHSSTILPASAAPPPPEPGAAGPKIDAAGPRPGPGRLSVMAPGVICKQDGSVRSLLARHSVTSQSAE